MRSLTRAPRRRASFSNTSSLRSKRLLTPSNSSSAGEVMSRHPAGDGSARVAAACVLSAGMVSQSASARVQRLRKAQPASSAFSDGAMPGIWRRRWPTGLCAGTESSRPCVYGWRGCSSTSSTAPFLDDAPGVHHRHAVGQAGDHGQVVRDPDQRAAGLAAQALHLVQDLALHGDVERGGRLVGDDDVGPVQQRDRDRHALAHAAGELVRVLAPGARRATRCRPGPAPRSARSRALRAAARLVREHRLDHLRLDAAAPGSASSSGPGRSSRCAGRAGAAALPPARPTSSSPCSRMLPPAMRPGASTRPMIE